MVLILHSDPHYSSGMATCCSCFEALAEGTTISFGWGFTVCLPMLSVRPASALVSLTWAYVIAVGGLVY